MSAKPWTILPTLAMTPIYSVLPKVSLVRLMTKSAPISSPPWWYSTSWTLGSFGSTALSSGWRSFTSPVIKSSFLLVIFAQGGGLEAGAGHLGQISEHGPLAPKARFFARGAGRNLWKTLFVTLRLPKTGPRLAAC